VVRIKDDALGGENLLPEYVHDLVHTRHRFDSSMRYIQKPLKYSNGQYRGRANRAEVFGIEMVNGVGSKPAGLMCQAIGRTIRL
jgi:hypothetical protein